MLWDQLRPGQKFEIRSHLNLFCSRNPHPRLVCHLLKPVHDARRVLTTVPLHDGMVSPSSHLTFPAGTPLQVRFIDPLLGCWHFHAGIAAYDQHEGRDALVLSARTTLFPCERRAFARQTCSIPVRLITAEIAAPIQATMLNYGAGGVFMVTECPLPLGRRLTLVLTTGLGYTLTVNCRVVRQDPIVAGFDHRYHVALQFDDPRPGLPFP